MSVTRRVYLPAVSAALALLLTGCGADGAAGPSWLYAPIASSQSGTPADASAPAGSTAPEGSESPAESTAPAGPGSADPSTAPEASDRPASTDAAEPTFPPDLEPSQLPAGFIHGFTKRADGPHGGPEAVDLPGAVAIDYWVAGTCDFDIVIRPATSTASTPVALFSMRMLGPVVSGTWSLTLQPGSYEVAPGEADGCTFSITVRAES